VRSAATVIARINAELLENAMRTGRISRLMLIPRIRARQRCSHTNHRRLLISGAVEKLAKA